jgi:hypothetical protein
VELATKLVKNNMIHTDDARLQAGEKQGGRLMKTKNMAAAAMALTLLGLASCVNHSDPARTYSNFYVVRNAERYPGFNGHLSWYGRLRAGDLMRRLQDSGINRIYVTPYSRTLETADSLRLRLGIDTVLYLVDSTAAELRDRLKYQKDYGRRVLIVGGRQTVPAILRMLGARYPAAALPDTQFNVLYVLVNDHGRVRLDTVHYGRRNLADTAARARKPAE